MQFKDLFSTGKQETKHENSGHKHRNIKTMDRDKGVNRKWIYTQH